MARPPEQPPPRLTPGTQVGAWRVEALQGQGAYGAVYRAVRVGQEDAGPVALKVSLYPWDARFAREAELLSRLIHPSIPRLLDRGVLRHAVSGAEHPFLVMEWVEGTPLYAWAKQQAPSFREVCRVLAQLARALEAIHAAGAVHRDVKGDNVLVRRSDRLPVLIDFGSGHFQGATRLTWQSLAPCTPGYMSAQAGRFEIGLPRNRDGYYAPTPADDLFALGVTAYRLVMGEYPPPMDAQEDEEGSWRVWIPDPRPLLERNPQVAPALREWILRLLSDDPQLRGTAAELAQTLEATAEGKVPERQQAEPVAAEELPVHVAPAVEAGKVAERLSPLGQRWAWVPWLALAATWLAALIFWPWEPVAVSPGHVSASPLRVMESEVLDAGTASVGDTTPTEPQAGEAPHSEKKPVAQEPSYVPPSGPRQQVQPDKRGRCPGRMQEAFDGGCWVQQSSMPVEACVENGYVLRKGKCYAPALEVPRKAVPTSSPREDD